MAKDRYFQVIPCVRVSDCNMETSHLAVSFPLTAAAGFADQFCYLMQEVLERELNKGEVSVRACGVAAYLHEFQVYKGKQKTPTALCKGNGGKPDEGDLLNPPLVEEVKGRLVVSIIIKLETDCRLRALDDEKARRLMDALHQTVFGMRFAGGDIMSIGRRSFLSRQGDKTSAKSALPLQVPDGEVEQLSRIVRRLPPGWFVADRGDLIEAATDKLQALLEVAALSRTADGRYERVQKGWKFVACTGYQLLENPIARDGRRLPELLHAYAEPVHSIADLVYGRRAIRTGDTTDWLRSNRLLWEWKRDLSTRTTYLSASI